METTSKKLMDKAVEEGKIPAPFLQLAVQIKDDAGKKKGVKGTGKHTVKFLSDKEVKGENFITKEERQEVEYTFEENGQKKKYNVPIHNDKGELHYFVQRMADIQTNETITLEYKKIPNSFKGFIEVGKLSGHEAATEIPPSVKKELKDKDIPIIEDDDIGEPPY